MFKINALIKIHIKKFEYEFVENLLKIEYESELFILELLCPIVHIKKFNQRLTRIHMTYEATMLASLCATKTSKCSKLFSNDIGILVCLIHFQICFKVKLCMARPQVGNELLTDRTTGG